MRPNTNTFISKNKLPLTPRFKRPKTIHTYSKQSYINLEIHEARNNICTQKQAFSNLNIHEDCNSDICTLKQAYIDLNIHDVRNDDTHI